MGKDRNIYSEYEELLLKRDRMYIDGDSFQIEYNREFGNLITENYELKIECIRRKKTIRFKNNSSIIPQEYLFGDNSPFDDIQSGSDSIVEILNRKLLEKGEIVQIQDSIIERINEKSLRKAKKDGLPKSMKDTNTKSKDRGIEDVK